TKEFDRFQEREFGQILRTHVGMESKIFKPRQLFDELDDAPTIGWRRNRARRDVGGGGVLDAADVGDEIIAEAVAKLRDDKKLVMGSDNLATPRFKKGKVLVVHIRPKLPQFRHGLPLPLGP